MGNYYPRLPSMATVGGVGAMGLLGYINVHKPLQNGLEWSDPSVLVAGATVVLATIAAAYVAQSFTQRRWVIAPILLLAVISAHTTDGYNMLEGLMYGREARISAIRDHNAAVDLAQQAFEDADREVKRLQVEVTKETQNIKCGSICKSLKADLVVAQEAHKAAEAKVLKLGVKRSERNIVAEKLGISEILVEVGPPLAQSGSLMAFGILFFCLGAQGRKEQVAADLPQQRSVDTGATPEAVFVNRVLAALKDEAVSNDELAERLGVVKSTASKAVTKLVKSGHVYRHKDGREVRIRRVA